MIFFDIDDTLMMNSRAQTQAALRFWDEFSDRLTPTRQEFPAVWDAVMQKHFAACAAGRISFEEHRRRRMQEILGAEDKDGSAFQAYLAHYEREWALFDDVLPCLDALNGAPLGIISNGNGDQQRRKLHHLGLADRFVCVVISEDLGVWKPNPEIFRAACKEAGASPEDCVYVGDSLLVDARASQAAGMRGIWLNRNSLPASNAGVPVIRSLSELPTLIASEGTAEWSRVSTTSHSPSAI